MSPESERKFALQEVTYFNFVEHLRLIELRVIDLLRVANYIALRSADPSANVRNCLMGSGPSAPTSMPTFIPPTLADDFSIGEEHEGVAHSQLPISRNVIKAVVMPTVRRKEHEALNRDSAPIPQGPPVVQEPQ